MDLTRRTYDKIANEYIAKNPPAGPLLREALNEFCSIMEEGSLVLDVGTGPARDFKEVAERGFRVFGVDYSFNMIKESGVSNVVQADALHLPFAENTFDALMTHATLHHVVRVRHHRFVQEVHRVLKPNGILHLLTREGAGGILDYTYKEPRKFNYLTLSQAVQLFSVFDLISARTMNLTPTAPGHQTPWISILARKRGT